MIKRYNNEIYEAIKKRGYYIDQYNYKYIQINNNIFYGYNTEHLDSLKYEFYGIIDDSNKSIINISNIEEIQKEYITEVENEATAEILKEYNYYKNIQKEAFNKLIKNDSFKRNIIYNYIDCKEFNKQFITGYTPEDLQKQLYNNIIKINKHENNNKFYNIYKTLTKSEIIDLFKDNIFNSDYISEWDFNYNYNNYIENEAEKIPFNFNNYISLMINKYDYIINEYKKIYENPAADLVKLKNVYIKINDFYNQNNNKTGYLYLKNDLKLKITDFKTFINIISNGREDIITYMFLTGPDRCQLEKYNEEVNGLTREDDLFIKDIKKITFNNKMIYITN